jgi:hypothetical protein
MALGRCIGQNGLLSCPNTGRGCPWVFEIGRQIFRPQVDVGEGGSDGVCASQRLRGGDAARDDLPAPGNFPVPVAGRTVRRNVVSVCGFSSLGFDWQHSTSPRVGASSRSPRGTSQANEIRGQGVCSKLLSEAVLFVVRIAHFGVFMCGGFSCRTASNNEEWTSRSPLYSM